MNKKSLNLDFRAFALLRFLAFALSCFFGITLSAQEINCRIQVNSDKIEGTNKEIFNTLSNNLTEFINTRKWTDAIFLEEERINCNFIFTISETAGGYYTGDVQIQANRPVFNSGYTTPLFNFKDANLRFSYSQFDRFVYEDNSYESNLLALVAYYINVILGLNFDSFGRYGGTKYFEKAEMVVALAQSSDDPGWQAFQSERNRYALISNLQDERLKRLRDVNYEYHRLGLDEMSANVEKGRSKIYSILPYLRELNRAKPFSVALQLFAESKRDELIDMFRNATPKEKREVYDVLLEILPTQSNKMEELLRQ